MSDNRYENEIVRTAEKEDCMAFRQLWKLCFGDSDAFCDWLFGERFLPSFSVCLEKDNEIVSAMQAVPYRIRVRGKDLPGAMLCGVSTHPQHRKKGYMGKIFTYEMALLRSKGVYIAVHTPAVLESYFPFGHYPVADAAYVEKLTQAPADRKVSLEVYEKTDWHKLYPLYQENIAQYSGAVIRTEAEWMRKGDDYAADGGKCVVLEDNGIKGYAFCYETETLLLCPEAVAKSGYYDCLVQGLSEIAGEKKLSVKLPPQAVGWQADLPAVIRQKGVAGACNIEGIMTALAIDCPYGVAIFDPVVQENNGNFYFSANHYENPSIKISAGHFLGVLLGYVSLHEVRPHVTIYDEEGYQALCAVLPKCQCYIIDEY